MAPFAELLSVSGRIFFLATSILLSQTAIAQELYMEPGDSHMFQTAERIATVFITSPRVADYEVIGEKSLLVYAQENGRTDLNVLDQASEQLLRVTLVVDPMLGAVQKRIGEVAPDSRVTIQKLGKTYVLSGTAATEDDRDKIYQIVGEGVGAQRIVNKKQVADVAADAGGGNDSSSWLDEVVYQDVINKLKLPVTNQINVKLSVVEVTKSFTDNVGIDWGTIGSANGSLTPGTFRFVKFSADTLSSMVQAIRNDTVARVLAEPNLSVISGETAEFLVGGEVPIVFSSVSGTSVQYKEFGIKLNVGARVSDSQRIRVTLGHEVSSVDGAYNIDAAQSFPAFQTRRAKTTVELADGESFLLGGLLSQNEREALSRLPFIGDIPLLGALFRHAQTERSHSELIVVATVNLVKPVTARQITLPDFQRTSTLARFLNVDGISDRRNRQLAEQFVEQGGFIK